MSRRDYRRRGRLPSRPSRNAGVVDREKAFLLLSGILIVASCILEGVDSLEDVGGGKDEGNLDSGKRTRAKCGVLSADALLVKILGSVKDSASCKKTS